MATASGVALDIHYCMGKRAGVDLYESGSDKCGRCGMKEQKKGCCHDEYQFHKLEDSHKNVSNNISFEAGEFAIATIYPVYEVKLIETPVAAVVHNNSPPADAGRQTCIRNCVFRL